MLQQLLPREALPALQADQVPLHGFHGQEGALLHFATGTDQSQPRPDPHGLRRIRRHRAAGLVRHQHGLGGREPAILPIVDLQSLRMGDDEAHVGLAPPREAPTGLLHGSGQRDLLRLVDSQPSQELEDPLVEAPALRELVAPAPRQVVQQLAVLQLLADLRPREAISTAGSCLKSPSSRKRIFLFILKQATCSAPDTGPSAR